jgi:O-antigen/teichoic acid export membrane protein
MAKTAPPANQFSHPSVRLRPISKRQISKEDEAAIVPGNKQTPRAADKSGGGPKEWTLQTRIAANTLWNLLATAAPMPVALYAIPVLIAGLGKDRFGLLALAWTLIGYFTLFDLGLGRALTQLVASGARLPSDPNRREATEIPAAFWTAEALMAILGASGAAILIAAANPIAHLLQVPAQLSQELKPSLYLVAAAIPLITVTAGLRGFLEARQSFALLAPIRGGTGVLLLLAPVLMLPYAKTLEAMLAAIVAVRVLSLAAHAVACIHLSPELWTERAMNWTQAPALAKFGGWLTVTNIISPLMVSMDRFLIGGQRTMTEVAYYATPYEIVTKYLILPAALVGVLFPAFSRTLAQESGAAEARRLYRRGMQALFVALLPLTAMTVLFARQGLTLWVGAEMASHGYRVLQILAIGVFINGMAQVPFTYIQGWGHPDVTAKFHLLELPVYVAALWCGIHWWGMEGAAIAWVGRVGLDTALLLRYSMLIDSADPGQQQSNAEPVLV